MSEGNKKKILIVEDDKTIQKALSIRLRAAGYAVATADDAVSAVPAVQKEQPQLILLDISIPGGDGFGVAARVRELPGGANIPFIFLTASKAPGFKERADQL